MCFYPKTELIFAQKYHFLYSFFFYPKSIWKYKVGRFLFLKLNFISVCSPQSNTCFKRSSSFTLNLIPVRFLSVFDQKEVSIVLNQLCFITAHGGLPSADDNSRKTHKNDTTKTASGREDGLNVEFWVTFPEVKFL